MPRFRELKQTTFDKLKHRKICWLPKVDPPKRMKDLFVCWKKDDVTAAYRTPGGDKFFYYDVEPSQVVYVLPPNNGLHATGQAGLFTQGALVDDDTPGA